MNEDHRGEYVMDVEGRMLGRRDGGTGARMDARVGDEIALEGAAR
jgi:hypothetical protein